MTAETERSPKWCPGSYLPASTVEWKQDGTHHRGRGACKTCWYSVSVGPDNSAHRHPWRGVKPMQRDSRGEA